jgi:phospholipid/cholesterol/gamma-HCH transport system permease protein
MGRLVRGKAQYRRSDLLQFIQECGVEALPIVTLISVLVGVILAFVGALQLLMFGAQVFVANLVGVGMAVEMGALMMGIIMAGRTGASFAAQLGTMQVNEEIDAMKTMGISPFEFLVLPRMLALILMMPLLCLYADFLGMLGGALVGIGTLDITPTQYFNQTVNAVQLRHFAQGLIKSATFGVVIAVCGCMQGINCGRSAQAVGEATTRAVVQCIIWIVLTDAMLTVIYNVTGF